MRKPIHQFLLMLLLAFAVAGVFGQSTVQAAGEFEVPTINDHFNQVEKGPEPKKEKIVTQNPPKEEKGFFEKIGDGISDAVDWVSDTASDVWNLGVDVAATAWDWIVENKEYISAAAVIIAGTVLCFVPGGQIIGPSILIGAGLAGGVAWFGGADSKEIAWDMFLGGLVGGASGGIGGMVANGIRTGGAGLLSRLGPVARKFLPEAIGTGAGGFTESVLWDKLKTGKINWKKAIITAGVGFGLILGAAKIGPTIINGINNLPIPSSLQTAFQTAGANTMGPQRFGDTPAGQWLQKFASNTDSGGNHSASTISDDIITDGSHFNADGTLRPNVRYQTGEYDYIYQTDHLSRITEFNAPDLGLTERANRLRHNPNTPGKQSGDHAGHLAGDRFGGSPELDNLVSQLSRVNLSRYKKLENRWARALQNGQHVSVNVRINYEGTSLRPSSFDVEYSIDGRPFFEEIPN